MYTIDKNSWHFRFAERFGGWRAENQTNLCPYVRMVLKGMALFTFLAFISVTLAILNLLGIADAVQGFWVNGSELSFFAHINIATLILLLIPVGVYVAEKMHEKHSAYKYKQYIAKYNQVNVPGYVPPQPGFIKLWWDSVHDKICPGIKIK